MEITFTTSNYNGANVSCFGSKDGSITVNVTGGTPPYLYHWSSAATANGNSISGLAAGYYSVIVVDSDSVQAEAGINIEEPKPIKLILETPKYTNGFNVSCWSCYNGSISTTAEGGMGTYTYLWKDNQTTTQNRTGLKGGAYDLILTDNNGCTARQQIILTEPERSDWTMAGNANTDPASQFIGTTDAQDLVMKTNGVERMRFLGNGNLRIYSMADSGTGIISVDSAGNLFRSNINIGHRAALDGYPEIYSYGTSPVIGTFATYCQTPYLYTQLSHQFDGMMESYHLDNSGHNHGYNVLRVGSDGQHGIIDADGLVGNITGNVNSTLLLNFYCGNDVIVGNSSNGKLGVGVIPNYRLDVLGTAKISGNVGIGVAPDAGTTYRLKVCGSIGAREVVIKDDGTFCDFVFDDNYERMTLDEKGNYFKKQKHLPYIASAKEITANGLPLKETLTGLTQNVEEMNLDMIDLYKMIQELKKENVTLKAEINELKKK